MCENAVSRNIISGAVFLQMDDEWEKLLFAAVLCSSVGYKSFHYI